MNKTPMKMGMMRRLSKQSVKFQPVNRKVQPKSASLTQRKTVDANRRFVRKYSTADLVSGGGAETRKIVSKNGRGNTEIAPATNDGPDVNKAANRNGEKDATMRPDFRPDFAKEKQHRRSNGDF